MKYFFAEAFIYHEHIPTPLRSCIQSTAQSVNIASAAIHGFLTAGDAFPVCNPDTPSLSCLSGKNPLHIRCHSSIPISFRQLANAILPHKTATDNMVKGPFYFPDDVLGTVIPLCDILHRISQNPPEHHRLCVLVSIRNRIYFYLIQIVH